MLAIGNTKICDTCTLPLPTHMFHRHMAAADGLKASCKICRNNGGKLYNLNLKLAAFQAYGGPSCMCCGETHLSMLALDHILNGGHQQRQQLKVLAGITFYRWLKKNSYPPGFQVMCSNCNTSKFINGGICEHKSTIVKHEMLKTVTHAN